MWYLDSISGKGFMSYDDFEYVFVKGKTTLIYGINEDELGADSNGTGKSAIVKAITIALLDLPDKSLTKEEYINDWTDRCSLTINLSNQVHNKTLQINREFRRNKDSSVQLVENGEVNEKLTSIAECNKRIIELIDISKEDILNYFIINQDNSNSFFEATDSNQKATITRFVNADLVDKSIQAVQSDIDSKNKEIEAVTTLINTNLTKIEVINQQIEYEKNDRLGDIEKEKIRYQEKSLQLQDKIKHCKEETTRYSNVLSTLEEDLSKLAVEEPDEESINELSTKLKTYKKKQLEFDQSLNEIRRPLNKINTILAGETKCPKCGWVWVDNDENKSIKELNDQKEEYEELISKIGEASKNIENRISKLRLTINQTNTQKEELEALRAEISSNKRKFNTIKQSIDDYTSEIKMFRKKISDLSVVSGANDRVRALEEEIISVSDQNDEYNISLSKLNEEKNELTFWNINLGIKGFKTFLVNKTLLSLEGHVNMHLSKFKTDLIVRIQGFKTLKTGDIRENITISISRDGGDTWKPFKRHSGGQRRRIDVCGILTVQSFINNSSKYGGLDLLILDEFFEGLDTKGQRGVLKILDSTNMTTLVISHNNNDIGSESQIWVRYKNKSSTIHYEKG